MNIPDNIYAIAEQIRTQDNLATDAPIFVVQQRRRAYGFECGHAEGYCYVTPSGGELDEKSYESLKALGSTKMANCLIQKTGNILVTRTIGNMSPHASPARAPRIASPPTATTSTRRASGATPVTATTRCAQCASF